MTIPNLITFGRIALVPLIVWALLAGAYGWAFALFLVAGVSDAVDGIVARFFNQHSALGQILDPLADKLMMLFVFVALSWLEHLPVWLVVIVVGRDVGLVAATAVGAVLRRNVSIAPLFVSKVTTTLQIALAAFTLFELAFAMSWPWAETALIFAVAGFTLASGFVYLLQRSQPLLHTEGSSTRLRPQSEAPLRSQHFPSSPRASAPPTGSVRK
ncbi:MAG: CDP-alcohol phosphatidyltransferase family protein [Pseudomonadota bacterium]